MRTGSDAWPEPVSHSAGESPQRLVIGGDIGGTASRFMAATPDGIPVGHGVAGPGNPSVVSWPAASQELGAALDQALAGHDPSMVVAAVVGLAGRSGLDESGLTGPLQRFWTAHGLTILPAIVGDLDVAFASATDRPDGTVLIAGTGAIAGSIANHASTRTADGHGWLLGDAGSGFWLGREAVRAALRQLDTGHRPGSLGMTTVDALLHDDDCQDDCRAGLSAMRDRVLHAVYRRPPQRLAELAPLVTAAAEADDSDATGIVHRAATALTDTLVRCRNPTETTPLVLAGSLLQPQSPVGRRVRELADHRFAGPLLGATNGTSGAAWLAIRHISAAPDTLPAIHHRLTQPLDSPGQRH